MLSQLPWFFWLGFGFLLLSTLAWYFGPETKVIHFALLFVWTLYLFVGPELMEVNGRVNDTYDWMMGVQYIAAGRFSEFPYSVYPGYSYISSILGNICGLSYFQLPHFIATVFHMIRAFAILALARAVFNREDQILLASLLLTALLWMPGTHPSPHSAGFIVLLFLLAIMFRGERSAIQHLLLFSVVFLASVTIHPVASLMVVLWLSVFVLTRPFQKRLGVTYIRSLSIPLLALAWTALLAWMLWKARSVFEAALRYLPTLLSAPLSLPLAGYVQTNTVYRMASIYFTVVYVAALLVSITVVILTDRHWHADRTAIFYPLFGVASTVVIPLNGFNAYDAFQRMYEYATPFVCWFLVQRATNRRLVLALTLVGALVLFPVGRYANEAVAIFSRTEVQGARFIIGRTTRGPRIVSIGIRPYLASLAGVLEFERTPSIVERPPQGDFGVSLMEVAMATTSSTTKNTLRYLYGDKVWNDFIDELSRHDNGIVYENGDFRVIRF